MTLIVAPALIPDVPGIYDAYFASFANDQMGRIILDILFPGGYTSPEFRKAHAEATVKYWHENTTQYTFKCYDTETGKIIGMALAEAFLQERSEEERKNPGVPWLEGKQKERAEAVLNPLWEAREKLFGKHKYIYCHVIAIDPKNQGRKAGALLVQWGLEMGEKTGLPVYFESSPSTVKLYERMGYQRLKEEIVHKAETLGTLTDIVVPLMVKMPPSAGNMTFEQWVEKGYPALGSGPGAKSAATAATENNIIAMAASDPSIQQAVKGLFQDAIKELAIRDIVKETVKEITMEASKESDTRSNETEDPRATVQPKSVKATPSVKPKKRSQCCVM